MEWLIGKTVGLILKKKQVKSTKVANRDRAFFIIVELARAYFLRRNDHQMDAIKGAVTFLLTSRHVEKIPNFFGGSLQIWILGCQSVLKPH